MMRVIEINVDGGSLSGYVVDAGEVNLGNYLDDHTPLADQIMEALREQREVVALLRNLEVDEEVRGQGIGTAMVEQFFEEAERLGATSLLLISDEQESQADGFELSRWYESFGFEPALATEQGPIMVMPDSLAEQLRLLAEDLSPAMRM